MDSFRLYIEESSRLDDLVARLRTQYPGLSLWVYENPSVIHLQEIKVPEGQRGEGIGALVIKAIQQYAQEINKPITLNVSPERGFKKKLEQFYRNLGFYPNKGRRKDYSIGGFFGLVWVWRPRT